MHPAQPGRLDSWKAIAEYLGRNVRTVTRWADERGMPVHRVPGGKRGAVFGFTEEIDAWLANSPQSGASARQNGKSLPPVTGEANGSLFQLETATETGPSRGSDADGLAGSMGTASTAQARSAPQIDCEQEEGVQPPTRALGKVDASSGPPMWRFRTLAWRIASVAAVLAVIGILISRVLRPGSSQASQTFSIKVGVDTVEAQDAQGRTLWSHHYPQAIAEPRFYHPTGFFEPARVADFFGDGKREAAVAVTLSAGQNPNDVNQSQIDFFSSSGKLLWRYAPKEAFQFGSHELSGPWFLRDLYVPQVDGRATLWAVAVHHTWGNGLVLQIDPGTGRDTLRFMNTGTVYPLNEISNAAGKFLLVGGFNNEWDGGSLAIVNEDKPFAASPQTAGTRHHCDSCPRGDPDYYFVFPRSEINRVSGRSENPITSIHISNDGIEVDKSERLTVGGENTVYLLESKPPFKLVSLRYNSDYDALHRAWSAEGKLSHSLEDCPERRHPKPVRLWTPSGGWTNLPVKPARADQ